MRRCWSGPAASCSTMTASTSSTTRRIIATGTRSAATPKAPLTGEDKKEAGRERGGRAALDQRHRGAGPQTVEGRARGLRPVGDPLLPARLGLSRRHPVPLGRVRFQPDGRDRERHRQTAARAGDRQSRRRPIRSSTAICGSISARTCRRPPRAPPSSARSTCPTCCRPR